MRKPVAFIRKVALSPWVGVRWVNALESAAKDDYSSARTLLGRLREFFEHNNPEYHLLRAYVNLNLRDLDCAVRDCATANQLLDGNSRYSVNERHYLRCYSSKVANLAIRRMPEETKPAQFDESDCVRFDCQRVRKALRRNFPMQTGDN